VSKQRARRVKSISCTSSLIVLAMLVVGFTGLSNVAEGATDPPANIPIGELPTSCVRSPTSAGCENGVIYYLNAARASLGLTPYDLPSAFTELSPDRQVFILSNLDRAAYTLTPVQGLNSTLDLAAEEGVRNDADPFPPNGYLPDGIRWWASNWAGGYENVLSAYYGWMYDDGYPGSNLDCTEPGAPGCWGHRHDVLASFSSDESEHLLSMGVAAGRDSASRPGYAMLIVGAAENEAPVYYSWDEAVADGAGTFAYDPGKLIQLTVSVQGTGYGTISGSEYCQSGCSITLLEGETLRLSATPLSGSNFVGWEGACSGTSPPCSTAVA
jgi:hypothetical protein